MFHDGILVAFRVSEHLVHLHLQFRCDNVLYHFTRIMSFYIRMKSYTVTSHAKPAQISALI